MRILNKWKIKTALMFISGASIVMLTSTILTSCTDKRIDKYEFDPNMPFSLKYTRNIKIKGDRERIMVLTDLHFHGLPDEDMENADKQTITNEFNDYRPDLILVLGDSIDDHSNPDGFLPDRWYENQTNFIHFMDTFKTPWAPIFGNHETSGGHAQDPNSAVPPHSKPKLAELFSISKYCLFQYGPIGFEDGKSGGGR